MAFDGSGTFTVDTSGIPVQYDTVISHIVFNSFKTELDAALSNTLCRDGQSEVIQNTSPSGFALNDVGPATNRLDAVNAESVVKHTHTYAGTVGGTADAITVSLYIAMTGYSAGMRLTFKAGADNTGAATINVSGLGAKSIVRPSGQALVAGDIVSGQLIDIQYDGTNFVMMRSAYSEGTWTPSVGGSATYTTQIGRWTRVGLVVQFMGYLGINANGTGRTNNISGLPFTSANLGVDQPAYVGDFNTLATNVVWISARVNTNSTAVALRNLTAAGASATSSSLLGNSTTIAFGGSYII